MKFEIKRATKAQSRARVALMGPAGSGKTWTALALATNLGKRVILIDTERGSASKYADDFTFDTIDLDDYHPQTYTEAIKAAEAAGADVIVVDSLSHAWFAALDLVDREAAGAGRGNTFYAWRKVTPLQNELVDTILRSRAHVIATLRTKTEYVIEQNAQNKSVPRKVGLAAVQRDNIEYEFDIVGVLDMDNQMTISKTRCRLLPPGEVILRPGKETAERLLAWLTDGEVPPEESATTERLRRKVRQGLKNIGFSENSEDVIHRMKERYGTSRIDGLSEEHLADFDRYINSVADRKATQQRQADHIRAVS